MRPLVHLDADAFFASVEQAADRRLRGIPMAVGGGRRGVIASASYEARAFGVRSAMATVQARRICPGLVVVPGRYDLYEQFSQRVFGMCRDLTPWVEQTSIDEGYFDLSGRPGGEEGALRDLRQLDTEITGALRITVSQGLGSNKLVTAVASKLRKPHGFVLVPAGAEADFLAPLPVSRLPGVGPKTEALLQALGVRTVADLRRLGPAGLRPALGAQTDAFLEAARGIDRRPLQLEHGAQQSYSRQETFNRDEGDEDFLDRTLKTMLDRLLADLRADRQQARTLTVRLRYADWEESSVSRSLPEPGDLEEEFYPLLGPLRRAAWNRRVHLRLAGVRLSHLYPARCQGDLFDQRRERQRALAAAADGLRRTYGRAALRRASVLEPRVAED